MKGQYRLDYNVLDSNKGYFYIIAVNCCVSIVLWALFSLVATAIGRSYQSIVTMQWAIYIGLIIVPISYLTLYAIYHKRNQIKLFKPRARVNVWLVVLSFVFGGICIFAVAPITNWISYALQCAGMKASSDLTFVMNNGWTITLGIIAYALLPAVAEELMYRKVIFNGYLSRYTACTSIIITALMFTFMHGSLQQFVYQLILGVLLTVFMYVTGNVLYPMILHFTNNCIVVILSITNADYLVSGNAFNVSTGANIAIYAVLALASLTIMLVAMWLIGRHTRKASKLGNDNIIINKQPLSNFVKSQSSIEQAYLIGGVVLALIIWITNTISYFG